MAEYRNIQPLIKYLEEEIKSCGEPDSSIRPIAYGAILGLKAALDYAKKLPREEVKHGCWLVLDVPPHWIYCSECNKAYVLDKDLIGKMCTDAEFCPHCGAKMDGKVD